MILLGALAWALDRASPPAPRPAPPPPVPLVVSLALPDGTPVQVVPRRDLPLVRVELDLRLPGDVDPARAALAALWTEGTRRHPGGQWRGAVESLGATVSAGCGALRCWVDVEAPTASLPAALALAAEVLHEPELHEVRALRRRWRAEWTTDVNAPDWVPELALDRVLWPDGHPFRQDRAPAYFDAIRPPAVRAARRTLLAEAQAGFVVAGDVDLATVPDLLAETFGAFPGRLPPPDPGAPAVSDKLVLVDLPGEDVARILVAWAGPPRGAPDTSAYALALRVLGGDFRSRLNQRLREERGLTYAARAEHQDGPRFGLSVARYAVAADRVVEALAAVDDLLAQPAPITAAEVDAARAAFYGDAARALSTLRGLAGPLSADLSAGRVPGEMYHDVSRLGDVPVEAVEAAARRWFVGPRVRVVAGDREVIEAALEDAGRFPDVIWSDCRATYAGPCP